MGAVCCADEEASDLAVVNVVPAMGGSVLVGPTEERGLLDLEDEFSGRIPGEGGGKEPRLSWHSSSGDALLSMMGARTSASAPSRRTSSKSVRISSQEAVMHVVQTNSDEKRIWSWEKPEGGSSGSLPAVAGGRPPSRPTPPHMRRKGVVDRTSSAAALGLGYVLDFARQEEEIARRRSLPSANGLANEPWAGSQEGPRLRDLYEVKEEIATGSFSTVFVAVPKGRPQQKVAVKCVPGAVLRSYGDFDVFHTETGEFEHLRHPHVLWRHQYFWEADCLYFVMDLHTGPNLFDKVAMQGTVAGDLACRYLVDMLSGLAYLHKHGIIHRDVKPENYILEDDRPAAHLRLMDFAVSRAFHQGEVIRTIVGTLEYTAPEVLDGQYDEKCDIWSCGCTAYFCSVGRLPIVAENIDSLVFKIRAGSIAWPGSCEAPEALFEVVTKMLQKNAHWRPSAAQILKSKIMVGATSCCGIFQH